MKHFPLRPGLSMIQVRWNLVLCSKAGPVFSGKQQLHYFNIFFYKTLLIRLVLSTCHAGTEMRSLLSLNCHHVGSPPWGARGWRVCWPTSLTSYTFSVGTTHKPWTATHLRAHQTPSLTPARVMAQWKSACPVWTKPWLYPQYFKKDKELERWLRG